MKNLNLFILFLVFGISSYSTAQNVNIPDANFKAALVANSAINTNLDTEIQVSEAAAFGGTMNVFSLNISDLTGIEAFTALTGLSCSANQLTALDISNNTALTYLNCNGNSLVTLDLNNNTALLELSCSQTQLTSIDLSNNTSLEILDCSTNQLITLNLSNNTSLITLNCESNQISSLILNATLSTLICHSNQLTSLDVSGISSLSNINCSNNQLTSLNVQNGNNVNIPGFYFSATGNPNLTCIEVDSVAYSNANWTNKDATASYSTNCLLSTTTLTGESANITTYPNPTNSNVQINLGKTYPTATVELRNIMGQTISSNTYNGVNQVEMNIEGAAGLYFVNIRTEEGEVVVKVVKE